MLFVKEIEVEFLLVGLYRCYSLYLWTCLLQILTDWWLAARTCFYLTCWHFVWLAVYLSLIIITIKTCLTTWTHDVKNTFENRIKISVSKIFYRYFWTWRLLLKTSDALSPSSSRWPWGYLKQCQTRRVMHSDRWLFRSGSSPCIKYHLASQGLTVVGQPLPLKVRLCYTLQVL